MPAVFFRNPEMAVLEKMINAYNKKEVDLLEVTMSSPRTGSVRVDSSPLTGKSDW